MIPPDDMLIEGLDITVRATNVLVNAGFTTVGEVRAASDRQLLTTMRVPRNVLNEIRAVLRGEEWVPPVRRHRPCPTCGGRGVL